ncbi:phosphotransferase family protein [Deinococcus planocerae]|uniref:phosphotransferase family protein n=1 Tax=Deinococcus planocerae TaxID=1737569 RepID=UPI000C7EB36A|nr:phosphotransferase [Deinococcus planocerae]
MLSPFVSDAVRVSFPQRPDLAVTPAGEGDYCRAFLVDHTWIFLFAKHPFASACLERVARVLPPLAEGSPLPVPVAEYHGSVAGVGYIGYRRLPGDELTAERFAALTPGQRNALAEMLGAFFRHLHAFAPARATSLGVPVSEYPFAMQDDALLPGPAKELYRRDLETFATWPGAEAALVGGLERALDGYLRFARAWSPPLVLLHNEVSADHVLYDPSTGRPSAVIDFNGMIVGRPARDFLYLYGEYGPDFAAEVLRAYGRLPPGEALEELRFLHLWHVLARLLWAVEHGYAARAEWLQGQLDTLLAESALDGVS